jgi:hypothetical protein
VKVKTRSKRRKKIAAGLVKDWLKGKTNLAKWIIREYSISCSVDLINQWIRHRNPPFPCGDANSQWYLPKVREWIAAHVVPAKDKAAAGDPDLFAKGLIAEAESKISKARKEKTIADKLEGSLIDRETAEHTIRETAQRIKNFAKQAVETFPPLGRKEMLESLGVDASVVAAFHSWDTQKSQEVMGRFEDLCAKASEIEKR